MFMLDNNDVFVVVDTQEYALESITDIFNYIPACDLSYS